MMFVFGPESQCSIYVKATMSGHVVFAAVLGPELPNFTNSKSNFPWLVEKYESMKRLVVPCAASTV
jgi:hypothetical protein